MPLTIITGILLSLLIPITGLHTYWLLGGQWALDACLPMYMDMLKKHYSSRVLLLLRFLFLAPVVFLLCFLVLMLLSLIPSLIDYNKLIYTLFSYLCILRAMLGWCTFHFFIKKQRFLTNNTYIFSPLFLIIGLLFLGLCYLS
tara:strand:- start:3093 stop:3521 length:429 start_codon:yes stop_codon:yes gene_type:complete